MVKVIIIGLIVLFGLVLPLFIFVTMQVRALRSHRVGATKYWITDFALFGLIEGPFTTLLLAEPKRDDGPEVVPEPSMAEEDGFGGGYIMPSEDRGGR